MITIQLVIVARRRGGRSEFDETKPTHDNEAYKLEEPSNYEYVNN